MHNSISSHFIKVADRKIHYLEAGSGEVILLLHGWPTSSYLWRNVIPHLFKTHRVIAPDLAGFGQSEKQLSDSYSFRFHAKIIDGFLQKLKIEKVNLGLHDLGGPLGLYWAVQDWTKVNRLIFFNTLVYPEFSWGVKLFGLATILPGIKNYLTSPGGLKKAMNFGVFKKGGLAEEVIKNYQAPFIDKTSRQVLLKTVQNLNPKGFQEIAAKLPEFKGPVQIIYAQNDRILPKVKHTMDRVKKDLPQAKEVIIPNCGHFLQEEVADRIGEELLRFLDV